MSDAVPPSRAAGPSAAAHTSAGSAWDVLVRRSELSATTVRRSTRPELADGLVRLSVERFGISANNITYVLGGDSSPLRWLDNFPAPEGFVRVPVWGFATVLESRHPGCAVGTRVFGYLPMSTDVDVAPHPFDGGLLDVSPHREGISEPYRRLVVVGGEEELDGLRTLIRPLFPASYFLADVVDHEVEQSGGPVTVLVTSASSKTALGTAHLLRQRGRAVTHGLTSTGNLDFVRRTELYDATSTYDDLPGIRGQVVLMDFSGRRSLLAAIHRRYGDGIRLHQAIGGTAQEPRGHGPALPGPAPVPFNGPATQDRYLARLGERGFAATIGQAEASFLDVARHFLTVHDAVGSDAVERAWARALTGSTAPDTVDVVRPRD